MQYCISRYQADETLAAASQGLEAARLSLDLGMSRADVRFRGGFALLPDGQKTPLQVFEHISLDDACYLLLGGKASRIQFFGADTGRTYKLLATGAGTAPTAELSGFRMHRVKGTDPIADARSKIDALRPMSGRVLDTCTGLGYTAIEALGAGASGVVTVERDANMTRLCGYNPWSRGLDDVRITRVRGDVLEEAAKSNQESFDAVIHDPPSMKIAGELYSREFYGQLNRVLKPSGRLFHYVGAPGAKRGGKKPVRGVAERLLAAGFKDVTEVPEALGVRATKYVFNPLGR